MIFLSHKSFPLGVIETKLAMNIITNTRQNENPQLVLILPEIINVAEIIKPKILVRKKDCDNGSPALAEPKYFSAFVISSSVRKPNDSSYETLVLFFLAAFFGIAFFWRRGYLYFLFRIGNYFICFLFFILGVIIFPFLHSSKFFFICAS